MVLTQKYHAIKVDKQKCIGCTHCMKVCPTEAIRIIDGVAVITNGRCVDCGNCLRACPIDAFYVEQGSLTHLNNFKYRVALLPAVFVGQFSAKYSVNQIYKGVLNLGFTHIFEVEQPIQILINAIKSQVEKSTGKPLISSFCPAIVSLIQCKYPSLAGNIVNLKSPHDMAASFAIEKLKQTGATRNEIGLFYVSPCSAKIMAIKHTHTEKVSTIDEVINMNEFYDRVMKVIPRKTDSDSSRFLEDVTRDGIIWSLPRGEARHFKDKSMAIDGITNVVKFLERLENEEVSEIDFLELKSCDQGCAGGILLTGNRFMTVERLQKRSKKYPDANTFNCNTAMAKRVNEKLTTKPIQPKYVFTLDENRVKALAKLQKIDKILCQLPAIDCGGCGAPNCHALAEDMVQGKAKMTDCIFLQKKYLKQSKITIEKAYNSLEKVWGEKRFEADCTKKGGRNEGF